MVCATSMRRMARYSNSRNNIIKNWKILYDANVSLCSWWYCEILKSFGLQYCEIRVLAAEPRSQKRSGDEVFEIPPARKPRYFE